MRFVADLMVDRNVKDDFGVKATAAVSTFRYEVAFDLNYGHGMLELIHESLIPTKLSDARKLIAFDRARSTSLLLKSDGQ